MRIVLFLSATVCGILNLSPPDQEIAVAVRRGGRRFEVLLAGLCPWCNLAAHISRLPTFPLFVSHGLTPCLFQR